MADDGWVSFEAFDAFCSIAREFNEWVPPERVKAPANAHSDAKGDRPGDDFNRRATWAEILEPHGWKVDRTAGDVTYWTRPGKSANTSATTGKCSSEHSGDLLYVFSSNAAPLDPDAAYSKFSAYAVLNHAGDWAAAAKDLAQRGYGVGDPADPQVIFGTTPPQPKAGETPDDGVAPDPDFATNADLRRLDLGVRWVWDKWLQVGTVNLLAAEGGMGKTRFMADLCRRIHGGLVWPDGTPTAQHPGQYLAMWVAGDRNHGELLELSEGFGFGDRICYSGSKSEPLGGLSLNTPGDFHTLYRRLKAARPLFLVVDTAGGATAFNLSKQEESRSFFAPLSDFAARLNLCVVVITHLNASKNVLGKRAEERVRVVLRMSAENREPETVRRVEVVKSNGLFPSPLGMTLHGHGSEYTTDAPAKPEDQAGRDDSDPSRGPPTKVRECMDWLTERLESAPAQVHKLRTEAEAKGFSAKVLYNAKSAMNLIEAETQGYKVWGLRK